MSPALRNATVSDARAMAEAVIAQPLLQRYAVSVDGLERTLSGAMERQEELLLVEKSGQVAGFAWFLLTGTFGLGGYLRLIALRPGEERSGLGAQLLEEVERRVAKHSRALFLLVSHWNESARRFYSRRGYEEVGKLPALLLPDTDEMIYCKRF